MLKLALGIVVLAHGVGHVLFLGPALRIVDWAGQTARSWLLTPVLGDAPARGVAALIWAATIVLFAGGVGGFLADQAWWRAVIVAGALVSLVGIIIDWDGIATSSAALALAVDLLILAALLLAHWPDRQLIGS